MAAPASNGAATANGAGAVNPAQAIALAMREFANARSPREEDVVPFLHAVGGYATLFGLVIAISDSLHLQLVRRVLDRLFDPATKEGVERLTSPEVAAYLLAALQHTQPKHVQLLALQQTHAFVKSEKGVDKLLQPELFDRLLFLLEGEDVELTEEASSLLLALGRTPRGLEALLGPRALGKLLQGVLDPLEQGGGAAAPAAVVDESAAAAESAAFIAPFVALLASQREHGVRQGERKVNSIILLRVLTLLTHVACGTDPSQNGAGASSAAAAAAAAPSSAAAVAVAAASAASSSSPAALRARGWALFSSRGLFALVLLLASPSSSPHGDLLMQLSAMELLEQVVSSRAGDMDDNFASTLCANVLADTVEGIERRARRGPQEEKAGESAESSSSNLISTSSFITVALLRVLNKLAAVTATASASSHAAPVLREWYRRREVQVFLSAALQAYDDEAVQTEALDVVASMSSFADGLDYFSSVVSSLPQVVQQSPSEKAAYRNEGYAHETSPVLLLQLPFFVAGSGYSTALRQLAALHGLARVIGVKYPDPSLDEERMVAPAAGEAGPSVAASAAAIACATVPASIPAPSRPSLQLRRLFCMHSLYMPGRSPVELLLSLARQPFEDVRAAVWSLFLALTRHRWGVESLVRQAGFTEYLLDRRTEVAVAGLRAKYEVALAIDRSPHVAALMNQTPEQRKALHEYVRQGVVYAPRTVGVMAPVAQNL